MTETTTQTTAQTTEPSQGAATAALAPQAPEWAADLDDGTKEYVAAKGFKDPGAVLKSYRELEQKFGADRAGKTVVIPDEGDNDGWSQLYSRIGRPDTPDGYGLDKIEGVDAGFAKEIAAAMHASGLPTAAAAKIVDAYQTQAAQIAEAAEKQFMDTSDKDMLELRRGWGQGFDEKLGSAKAAAKQFGFTGDELDKIERAIGTKNMLQRLADIGSKLGEDKMPGDASAAGAIDPRAEIDRLKTDKEFREALTRGDKAAADRWADLHKALVQRQG